MTTQKRNRPNGSRGSRRRVELKDQLRRGLTTYSTAAGAACVGVVALARPAQADIIVNNSPISIGAHTTVPFQIKGVAQFTFVDYWRCCSEVEAGYLLVYPGPGHVLGTVWVARLAKDAVIGPSGHFLQRTSIMEYAKTSKWLTHSREDGNWSNQSGYFGFEFLSSGKTHFGWAHAQVSRTRSYEITGTIDEFAYDTIANQAIYAGQTSSTPEPGTLACLHSARSDFLSGGKRRSQ